MSDATDPAVVAKPRRWPIALLVAFITGLAGAILVAPISEWAMKAHHVSSFEGGRAYMVVCIWIPLGFIAGCVTGLIVALTIKRTGLPGYALKQGISIVAIAVVIGAVGGLSYAAADHPPLIDGKGLALEIEVRVPAKGRTIADLQAQDFTIALVVSASDRHYSDLRWSEATQADEFITLPAWARLNSRNANREITAGFSGPDRQSFNVLLPASPRQIDEAWPEWAGPHQRFDGSKPAPDEQYFVRYRVRFAQEYEPTPTPTGEEMTEQPSPEETAAEPAESP